MQQVGIDIVEIARIERAVERWGQGFLERVYTGLELEWYVLELAEAVAEAFERDRDFVCPRGQTTGQALRPGTEPG